MGYYDEYLEHSGAWKNHKYIKREPNGKGWKYTYEKVGLGLKGSINNQRAKQNNARIEKHMRTDDANRYAGFLKEDLENPNEYGMYEQLDREMLDKASHDAKVAAGKERTAKAKADIAQAKYDKSLIGSIEKWGKQKLKDIFK